MEDHLLRKRVHQFYAIKVICLTNKTAKLDDHIAYAAIQIQINDKESEMTFFLYRNLFNYKNICQ